MNFAAWSRMARRYDYLETPTVRLLGGLATLLILSVIGFYFVRKFRDSTEETETSGTMLTKFEESRHRGELGEAEFRTIKTILAERMQAELKRKDDSG